MSTNASSTCAALSHNKSKGNKLEESDEDLFRVPDMELEALQPPSNSNNTLPLPPPQQQKMENPEKGRRGRNPVNKEYKRLKRLLRNRVSAQEARERKKVYASDLELRAKQLQEINSQLEENISTLNNENSMLRKLLMNTRPKVGQSIDPKNDIQSELAWFYLLLRSLTPKESDRKFTMDLGALLVGYPANLRIASEKDFSKFCTSSLPSSVMIFSARSTDNQFLVHINASAIMGCKEL